MFVGHFLQAIRMSIGDFDNVLSQSATLPKYLNWMSLATWLMVVVVSNIIFLNF